MIEIGKAVQTSLDEHIKTRFMVISRGAMPMAVSHAPGFFEPIEAGMMFALECVDVLPDGSAHLQLVRIPRSTAEF